MHHSDEQSRETAVVTCYLDESGSEDLSATAVLAGLLLNRSNFFSFEQKWAGILTAHKIPKPLHMRDFRRGRRLAKIPKQLRTPLFDDVVELINSHKIISVAATITQGQFQKYFSKPIRRQFLSAYGMNFIVCALLNFTNAKQNKYEKKIAYLVDEGNPYRDHILNAHAALKEIQKSRFLNLGSIAFDGDQDYCSLQAADVIAWSVRRSATRELRRSFLRLSRILESNHVQLPLPEESMLHFSSALNEFLMQHKDIEQVTALIQEITPTLTDSVK